MKGRENTVKHIARVTRPHLAQEYKDRGKEDEAESITRQLTEHARLCARGEVRPGKGKRGTTPS